MRLVQWRQRQYMCICVSEYTCMYFFLLEALKLALKKRLRKL